MCGIAGYSGSAEALPILIKMLKRLEYRGYDSAGLALANGSTIDVWKREGDVEHLREILPQEATPKHTGIAHTRWATHGIPSDRNAHPISDCHGKLVVVHNGVIDNYLELRQRLLDAGHHFTSDTDTEILAHLMEEFLAQGLDDVSALAELISQLEGTYALAILVAGVVPRLLVTRLSSPVVIGSSSHGTFISSDAAALHGYTSQIFHLSDLEVASICGNKIEIRTATHHYLGLPINRQIANSNSKVDPFDYSGHQHYMHKEIWEQPLGLSNLFEAISASNSDKCGDLRASLALLNNSTSVIVAGCGSSYLAGEVGRYWLEELSDVPVETEYASELAYRRFVRPRSDRKPAALLISQSGETADVLAALTALRQTSIPIIALTNAPECEVVRRSDASLLTHMGSEIAVASTKTFTAQLLMLGALSVALGRLRGKLAAEDAERLMSDLLGAIASVRAILSIESNIQRLAARLYRHDQMFVLGRGVDYPIAMEVALKLREVAYVGAQGFAGAELKHGNLALFSPETPVICLAMSDVVRTRMLGNIEEVRARGVPTVLVSNNDQDNVHLEPGDLVLPDVRGYWSAIPTIVALHLLAYHIAVLRECPIDHPRNLAKSSTVQ